MILYDHKKHIRHRRSCGSLWFFVLLKSGPRVHPEDMFQDLEPNHERIAAIDKRDGVPDYLLFWMVCVEARPPGTCRRHGLIQCRLKY